MRNILIFCFTFVIITMCPYFLSGENFNNEAITLSAGSTIDVTPFGVEQFFLTVQGAYILAGNPTLSCTAAFAFNKSAYMIRIPILVNIKIFSDKIDYTFLSFYAGGGKEFYRSSYYNTFSPLLTGGIKIIINSFCLDVSVTGAFRSYNTDSDIGITVGLYI